MFSKVLSSCVQGIDGHLIDVEVDLSNGLPQFNIVGLPDSAVRESIERVRAAIKNCGFEFPLKRITVNLAPAYIRKEGAAFDLAIALGILLASNQLPSAQFEHTIVIGELSLDGSLKPIPGVIAMASDAYKHGIKQIILPIENAAEASLIKGLNVYGLRSLAMLSQFGERQLDQPHMRPKHISVASPSTSMNERLLQEDYADVRGQPFAKRAILVAAAGMHNIILIGPPGAGKTMLMRRMPTIMPPLTETEALEVTKIYSIAKRLPKEVMLMTARPFRAPHHTISQASLIGGGANPKPGEISLAHQGILFLDELPEFPRHVLEVLRQPLEDRQVTISRSLGKHTFPAHFIFAASMNPCPCGYKGHETEANICLCTPRQWQRYRSKISGPLFDRIDLHVEVPRIDYATFIGEEERHLNVSTGIDEHITSARIPRIQHHMTSAFMQRQIIAAQSIQSERYKNTGIQFNSQLKGRLLREHCKLNGEAENLLRNTFDVLGLSMRAHDRILKIARTIADLEACDHIQIDHIAEAIQYRTLDRNYE